MENPIKLRTIEITRKIRTISIIALTVLCVILLVLTAMLRPAYLRADTYTGNDTVPLSRARFASRSHLYYTGGQYAGGFRIHSDTAGYMKDGDAEYAFLYKGQLLSFNYELQLMSNNQKGPIRLRLTSVSGNVPGSVDFTVYPKGTHYAFRALKFWLPAAFLGIAACALMYVIPSYIAKKDGILVIDGMPDEERKNVEYLVSKKRTANGYEPIYKYYLDGILPKHRITEAQVRQKIGEYDIQRFSTGKLLIAAALMVILPFMAINVGYMSEASAAYVLAFLAMGGLIAGGIILKKTEAKRNAK